VAKGLSKKAPLAKKSQITFPENNKKLKFLVFNQQLSTPYPRFQSIHIESVKAPNMATISEIDRAILGQLRINARMSYVDLAKNVGASERTIRTHIRKMEENGTIRGYTVREGGVGLTALVRIKVSPGAEIGSLAGEVSGWSGIELLYEVSGETDLIALVHVDDTMSLRALLDRIWMAAPAEIASTTTELVLEQY
jgi:DNA-binding Lrp family transcriptional regulator